MKYCCKGCATNCLSFQAERFRVHWNHISFSYQNNENNTKKFIWFLWAFLLNKAPNSSIYLACEIASFGNKRTFLICIDWHSDKKQAKTWFRHFVRHKRKGYWQKLWICVKTAYSKYLTAMIARWEFFFGNK